MVSSPLTGSSARSSTAPGLPPRAAHQVGAPVHAVGEVHVPGARRTEERLVLGVAAMTVAVRRRIVVAQVGLGLDDPSRPCGLAAERRDTPGRRAAPGRRPPRAGRKTRRAAWLPVGCCSLRLLFRSRPRPSRLGRRRGRRSRHRAPERPRPRWPPPSFAAPAAAPASWPAPEPEAAPPRPPQPTGSAATGASICTTPISGISPRPQRASASRDGIGPPGAGRCRDGPASGAGLRCDGRPGLSPVSGARRGRAPEPRRRGRGSHGARCGAAKLRTRRRRPSGHRPPRRRWPAAAAG